MLVSGATEINNQDTKLKVIKIMDEVRVKRSFSFILSFYNAVLLYSLLMECEDSFFTLSPSLFPSKSSWMGCRALITFLSE